MITYRPRLALRDAGRALGYTPEQSDAWVRQIGPGPAAAGEPLPAEDVPAAAAELARQMQRLPRHLGIHSGGMVICDRPVGEVCPVEWARMPGRTVLQWDKDDCAYAGLVKFDLLGLGMLAALHDCFDLVAKHHGEHWTMASIPQEDPVVYQMLAEADTVGVFQVESRAQMATLPRLRPKQFYDLVIEVALIRPGPIQGGSVHPYLRRRDGLEDAAMPHESMRAALGKTLGVPLFQEQQYAFLAPPWPCFWCFVQHILEEVLAADPKDAVAQNNLGFALLEKGRVDEAISHLHQAIAAQPNSPEAYYNLGRAFLKKGQFEAAAAHFQMALSLRPDFANACCNLGFARLQLGQVAAATAAYEKALDLAPDYALAHNDLGGILLRLGETNRAMARFSTRRPVGARLRGSSLQPGRRPAGRRPPGRGLESI